MSIRRGMSRLFMVLFASTTTACDFEESIVTSVSGAFADGMCMCAVCWDRPFCWSAELGEGVAAAAGAACPSIMRDGRAWTTTRAPAASRIGPTFGPRIGGFYCVPPMEGAVLDAVGDTCPRDEVARSQYGNVDPCMDVPLDCREPENEFVMCGEVGPVGTPACIDPFRGPLRSGCSNKRVGEEGSDSAELRARGKVIDACDIRNQPGPPSSAQPERYCFASCSREYASREVMSCSEELFDPPELTPGSYFTYALPGSTIRVTTESDTEIVPLEGEFAVSAPRCGPGDTCSGAMLPWLYAERVAPVAVDGLTLRNVIVRNPEPFFDGGITPVTGTRSKLTFAADKMIYLSADIDGLDGRRGEPFVSTVPVVAYIDWTGRVVTVDATFLYVSPEGNVNVTLHLVGSIPNLAPRAIAGPDQTLECTGTSGALVNLSALASWDPDSPQRLTDFRGFGWVSVPSSNFPGQRTFQSRGTSASFLSPIGTRVYSLMATDRAGSSTSDGVRVTVRDTNRPKFKSMNLAGQCIQANNAMRLFQPSHIASAFSDQCDSSVTTNILNVRTDVPDAGGTSSPDIIFGATSFCIRGQREAPAFGERKYYVDVQSRDDSGNTTTSTIIVRVPAGTACPEGSFWTVPTVAPTSTLCRR